MFCHFHLTEITNSRIYYNLTLTNVFGVHQDKSVFYEAKQLNRSGKQSRLWLDLLTLTWGGGVFDILLDHCKLSAIRLETALN